MVWNEPTNPNQTATSVMEQKGRNRCHKKHSLIGSERANRQAMSKVEDTLALSLSNTQARMPMRRKVQLTS
jgi:hypothetical protein